MEGTKGKRFARFAKHPSWSNFVWWWHLTKGGSLQRILFVAEIIAYLKKQKVPIEIKRYVFLQDMLNYYTVNPSERRCLKGFECFYSPVSAGKEGISEGCAIGRKIDPDLAKKLDENKFGGVHSNNVFKHLPKEMQELGLIFLEKIQFFHDDSSCWDDKGLSKRGKEVVKGIVEEHCQF